MHISAIRYLEKWFFCFNKVTGDDEKIIEDGGEAETVSDSINEDKK